jgi:hypothetical protein
MAWLSGYSYRKSITLSRASGAVTNYQMKLLVGESSGASGEDVDCNSHCATDFDDLRFTTSDETTLLDYWIESVSGTTPNQLATVWIEFNSIGTGATTFYMYYGNSGASAATSGTNTFPFFDDFNDSSLNGSLWTDLGGSTEGSGTIVCTANSTDVHGIQGKTFFGTTYATRARLKPTHYDNNTYLESFRFSDDTQATQAAMYFCHVSDIYDAKHINYLGASPKYTASAMSGASANTWMICDIRRNGTTNVTYLIDNANTVTITTNVPTANLTPDFITYSNASTIEVDWVLVRQYLATEPAWGSWGDETAGGATLPLKNVFNRPFRGVFR